MTRVPSTQVLRLQVADDPSGLVNLVANPNGELGGWGWVTPGPGTAMSGDSTGLTYRATVVGFWWFQTEDLPIAAGRYAASSWRLLGGTPPPGSDLYVRNDVQWINSSGAVISTTTPSPYVHYTDAGTKFYGPNQAPVGTVKFRVRFTITKATDGTAPNTQPYSLRLDQVTAATAATAAELGTMVTNLVADPDIEAVPITDNWAPSGPNNAIALDATQHWHGVTSAKLTSTAKAVRTNLLTNPSVETNLTGWTAGPDSVMTRDTTGGNRGPACIHMRGTGANDVVLVSSGSIPVTPGGGNRVRCRADMRVGSGWPTTCQARIRAQWYDSPTHPMSGSAAIVATAKNPARDVWFTLDAVTPVVPAGATHVRLLVDVITGGAAAGTGAVFLADGLMLEAVTSTTLSGGYIDGAQPSAGPVSYAWTGAANASTSTETTKLLTVDLPGIRSAMFPIRPGRPYTVSAALRAAAGSTDRIFLAWLDWFDIDHQPLTPASGNVPLGTATSSGWNRYGATFTTPAAAGFAQVTLTPTSGIGALEAYYADAVQVEPGSVMGPFVIGQTTTAGLPYIPPVSWVDIIGSTHDITVARQSLNVGTLTATVLDANLDPSTSTLIRPGRALRLMAYPSGGPDWSPVFTGSIAQAEVTYDPETPAPKRAKVALSAVDNLARLANIARDQGVGTIAELPYVLEGCGVPWDVNGSGNQVPTATVVARNDSSSALDQVAITRDSTLGVAWLDRFGTLHAYDNPPATVAATLDESAYSDIDISFNSGAVINEVNLAYQRFNPTTGDTDEIPYGPYVDTTSVAEWGAFSADFRVQGIHEDDTTLAAYAQAILDANSEPVRRINSVTVPISKPEHISPTRALLDLENLTTAVNVAAGLSAALRIESIEHHITTTTWVMVIGFSVDGQVASPTFTPAPGNTSGQTLDQLLRPVGEVTMFCGAKSAIPAGWLPCDGSTFPLATYPALGALLGTTTLPDFTDRFPIGAGTKALGTTGGSPTHTQTLAELASHNHTNAHNHSLNVQYQTNTAQSGTATRVTDIQGITGGGGTGASGTTGGASASTGSTGSASPMDVLNPWRSLWFIIRAA